MAIEDAVMLSRCIEELGTDDHTSLFKLYEDLRYDRTTAVHQGSQHNMWMKDSKEDPGWLYRHDVLTLPLVAPVMTEPAPQTVA